MAFAKLKARLRQAAACTLAELQLALGHTLATFTPPAHCQAFFCQAQYAQFASI